MAENVAGTPFDAALAELAAYLNTADHPSGPSPSSAPTQKSFDVLLDELHDELERHPMSRQIAERARAKERPRSPVPDFLLQQQREGIPNGGDTNPSPGVGMLNALGDVGRFGAEMTGVPSVVRGIRHLADENGDGWTKAKGAGEVVLGAMPGLTVVRGAAPVLNALAGTAPRALGTIAAATVPSAVVGAREDSKAADDALSTIRPPEYMTTELEALRTQKTQKQQEFNAVNQRHAKSGPETQRQALDPLRADLADLNQKISDAEGRIRTYMEGETEKARKELPFRQRYPGAAETIGGGAAALSTFLPFASTMKTRIGNAVEGMLQGRAATQANKAFEAGKLPEFVEAQNALGRRIENLDNVTSGVTYNTLGAKPGDVAKGVGLGTLLNFEGASIPEQVDALAFPPGHPTRTRARAELTSPDYYASRALPALLWGVGTTGIGTEAGALLTPGGKVPERAREIVNRGSDKSIADLERIGEYVRARAAAQSGGQQVGVTQRQLGDAQQLEGAASAPAPQARAGTSGQPSQSAAPEAGSTDQPRLVDRLPVYRAQAQSPATGAFSNQPALSEAPYQIKGKDGRKRWHDAETGDFASPPTRKR